MRIWKRYRGDWMGKRGEYYFAEPTLFRLLYRAFRERKESRYE